MSFPRKLANLVKSLFVDPSTGNVGVGTSSPTAKLHVEASTGRYGYFFGKSSASISTDVTIGRSSSSTSIDQAPNLRFEDGTTNNTRAIQCGTGNLQFWGYRGSWIEDMRIDSSGSVRIGSTSDDSNKLTLSGAAGFAGTGLSLYETSTGNNARLRVSQNAAAVVYNATYSSGGNAHVWQVGNAEAARIDSAGGLRVNATSAAYSSDERLTVRGSSSNVTACMVAGGTTIGQLIFLNSSYGLSGYIQWSGSTTSYVTSSDYRLKENVQPMTGALEKVQALKPVTYKWKADGSDGQGFIAHELQSVVPDCVIGEKDAIETYTDESGVEQTRPKYQGIDTSFLVATLTAAIQEQQAMIEQLKADVAALKAA